MVYIYANIKGYIDGINVTIYSSTMDPMGNKWSSNFWGISPHPLKLLKLPVSAVTSGECSHGPRKANV
jgi:hypothetical protein